MAASSRLSEELRIPRKSWTRNQRPGNEGLILNNGASARSPFCIEPNSKTLASSAVVPARKVPVLYYLSRNGQLEHPHLIEVPLSSSHGLYLRDVMNTLNCHRGKGIANIYSWSFKRSYKSGYVWHDASEDDLIQPTNGHDYVLKGSELLQIQTCQNQAETYHSGDNFGSTTAPAVVRRNQSWSSFDNPQECLALKCESNRELAAKFAPDAATQTEEQGRQEHVTVELSTDEIPSPPPSNSSSEVSEAVNGSRYVDQSEKVMETMEDRHGGSGRMKVSQVLMQLFTCGADSCRHVRPLESKQDQACQADKQVACMIKALKNES
ncbi:protein SOSEKI 5 [Lactuca sativa]|uniref:SOSEKI DIX-like domain-containing protein n=1 Tax=Lactuca sativa TaxID=4236 RepID=A0A9R1UML1_LACSA|nr:protein SOSEKI 5 [Lactuca sativa]KAJ0190033.1 hypothetical protein LSAT_V11C800395750 [Lactuca sativa]